jgi:hypothetical protein
MLLLSMIRSTPLLWVAKSTASFRSLSPLSFTEIGADFFFEIQFEMKKTIDSILNKDRHKKDHILITLY